MIPATSNITPLQHRPPQLTYVPVEEYNPYRLQMATNDVSRISVPSVNNQSIKNNHYPEMIGDRTIRSTLNSPFIMERTNHAGLDGDVHDGIAVIIELP